MYLKERFAARRSGIFVEIGVGQGTLSRCLLDLGWSGLGLEVDAQSAEIARRNTAAHIQRGAYQVLQVDWVRDELPAAVPAKADLILSSMVLEHLDEDDELRYFHRCAQRLATDGRCVVLVPASPRAWGIEDEIAGHFRRYTFSRFRDVLPRLGWRIEHMAGLTFPVSNMLLPISNRLVARAEVNKQALSMQARTRESGRREVYGKTVFPSLAGAMLNEHVMYPLHLLQKVFSSSERALVIYLECAPAIPARAAR